MKISGYLGLIVLLWLGAFVAVLIFPLAALIRGREAKEYLRALDQLVNAAFFGGQGRESTSSHAWRTYATREYIVAPYLFVSSAQCAKFVIWLTDLVEPGHCEEANEHEQPVVDFIEHPENWTRREGC